MDLFVRYGPQVSRWGEQGFFQMLFWNRTFSFWEGNRPINALEHLYGATCQKHLVLNADNVTKECPQYPRLQLSTCKKMCALRNCTWSLEGDP